jgi:AraC family transcriptional activator of pobA
VKGFKVYQLDTTTGLKAASRRDLYTISLLKGLCYLPYADGEVGQDGTYLLVGTPGEGGSSWQGETTRQTGYRCLLTEDFMEENFLAEDQPTWALFTGSYPRVFSLGDEQAAYMTSLFQKMLAEQQSAYPFKQDLLRSYLHLVLHEAIRLHQPAPKRLFRYYCRQPNSAGALTKGWGRRRHV